MTTILIGLNPERIPRAQMERIWSAAGEARLVITEAAEEMEPYLEEIEVAAGSFPADQLARMPALRWYQQWGAGADWLIDAPELAAREFTLTNASGVHAIPISEHILAYLLAFARRLPRAVREQQRHAWEDDGGGPQPFELAGTQMLLVGVGAIGRRTAQIASALGMTVNGVRGDPEKTEPGVQHMLGLADLPAALPEADFVVLTLPLTRETRGLFNAGLFQHMKPGSYLVNIGRGGLVDEAALVQALRSGQIAGAGLDVFETEPLPAESPLWDMENVIITPHTAGSTPHYDERALEIFIENLEHYKKGEPLQNVVDKQKGY